MARTTPEKVFGLEAQLEKMESLFGVSQADAINVFSSYKKTVEQLITEEVDVGTKYLEFQNPLGAFALKFVEEREHTNSSDGLKYMYPAHYIYQAAAPIWVMNCANKGIDFSKVPSHSDIEKSKKKVAVAA